MWLCQKMDWHDQKRPESCVYLSFLFCQIPSVSDRGGREGTKENENVWFLALSVLRDYQVCSWGLCLLDVEYFVMDFLSLSRGWLINWVLFSHPMMHCPITNQSFWRALKILTDKVTMKYDSSLLILTFLRFTFLSLQWIKVREFVQRVRWMWSHKEVKVFFLERESEQAQLKSYSTNIYLFVMYI